MVTALGPGVTVAHKMWSVTSGSNFDWKNLVICIDGSLWEVVAHEWWAHMEVWLSILGCLAYLSYIEKVWGDVRTAREAQDYKWLRVLNFSLGFHFWLLSKPSLSTNQWVWESYSWFFLLLFFSFNTVKFLAIFVTSLLIRTDEALTSVLISQSTWASRLCRGPWFSS